jgi:hypothetical protein
MAALTGEASTGNYMDELVVLGALLFADFELAALLAVIV